MKTCIILFFLILSGISQGQVLEWATGTQGKGGVETYGVDIDSEGNVYSVGDFLDTIDVDPSDEVFELVSDNFFESYKLDGYIQKLDKEGNHLWAYRFGRYLDDALTSIIVGAEDNLYVLGTFSDTVDFDLKGGVSEHIAEGSADFIAKYDSDANLIWTYIFESGTNLNDLSQDGEGNITITGTHLGRIFIAKLTLSGALIWSHELGEDKAKGFAIDCDSDNNIYVSGTFETSVDFDPSDAEFIIEGDEFDDKAFFLKLNAEGDFVWVKSVNPSSVSVTDVEVDDEDNIYTTGSVSGETDMDPGPGVFSMIAPQNHTYVYKLSNDGEFEWMRYGRGTGASSKGSALEVDDDNNIYVTGSFSSILNMYGWVDGDVPNIESVGSTDIFIYHLSDQGDFLSIHGFGGIGQDGADCIILDEGNLFTCGYFQSSCNVDPYGEGYSLEREVLFSYSGYIQKINLLESADIEKQSLENLSIYPNPFSESLSINFENADNNETYTVTLYEPNGRIVSQQTISALSGIIDVSSLKAGMYFMQIVDSMGHEHTEPVVKY